MFSTLGTWNWFISGGVLMALELLAPGVFMLWLGLAALAGRAVSFARRSVLAGADPDVRGVRGRRDPAVAALRAQQQGGEPEQSVSQPRADALVGRVFTLEKPIIDGVGTMRIDDTVWRVAGPDCAGRQPGRSCRPTARA